MIEPLAGAEDVARVGDPRVDRAVESAARYAALDPQELEALTNRLLGISDEAAKALVFNVDVVRLLHARAEAKRLQAQGSLVDV